MKRKYQLDESFFDEINTQDKAYCLGFLFADGCNLLHRGRISIGLHEKDVDILQKLSYLFFGENCIKFSSNSSIHSIDGKICRSSGRSVRLSIYSKRLSNRLNDLGMVPRKSSIVKFPSCVPPHLLNHFVRGYFDGDGSLIRYKSKRGFSIKIASSFDFCSGLKTIIQTEVGINGNVSVENDNYSCFLISGIHNSKRFCDWIYSGATILLRRKFEIYLDLCKRVKSLHRATYKYVYLNKKLGTWIADVYLGNKKMKRLGDRFPTEQAAYEYQQQWINEIG